MPKLKIQNLGSARKLTAEDMTQVKGGGGYIKIGDIKGECTVRSQGDEAGTLKGGPR